MPTVKEIIARCEAIYDDIDFTAAREWKAAEPDRQVIGYMPIYVPREIIHAAGMLPLGILGGGPHPAFDHRTRGQRPPRLRGWHAVPQHLRRHPQPIRHVAVDDGG
jgi:hypothetical protein